VQRRRQLVHESRHLRRQRRLFARPHAAVHEARPVPQRGHVRRREWDVLVAHACVARNGVHDGRKRDALELRRRGQLPGGDLRARVRTQSGHVQSAQLHECGVRRVRRRRRQVHGFERHVLERRAALQLERSVRMRRNVVRRVLRREPAVPHVERHDVRRRWRDLQELLGLLHLRRTVRKQLLSRHRWRPPGGLERTGVMRGEPAGQHGAQQYGLLRQRRERLPGLHPLCIDSEQMRQLRLQLRLEGHPRRVLPVRQYGLHR